VGKNAREVLDFNLYLSPNDVWSATPTMPILMLTPRCTLTGNPCGTDTVRKGDTCPDARNNYACAKVVPAQRID
jgi:hypothetical protein